MLLFDENGITVGQIAGVRCDKDGTTLSVYFKNGRGYPVAWLQEHSFNLIYEVGDLVVVHNPTHPENECILSDWWAWSPGRIFTVSQVSVTNRKLKLEEYDMWISVEAVCLVYINEAYTILKRKEEEAENENKKDYFLDLAEEVCKGCNTTKVSCEDCPLYIARQTED